MQVMGIATKPAKRALMDQHTQAEITIHGGLTGDYRGKRGQVGLRQVTLLCADQWLMACHEVRKMIAWQNRRANMLLDCPCFGPEYVGKEVHFHDNHDLGVILEITGETDPCERMDEVHPGLRKALTPDWRGGVTCRVIRRGTVRVNMWISIH